MEHSALRAYESASRMAPTARELEATALFKAARQLEACQQTWDAADRATRCTEALRYNQRLWTFFQTELASPNHQLDRQIRQSLLTLSVFIDRRTFEIMANPGKEKLQALIDINRNVAAGLTAKPPVNAQTPSNHVDSGT
jgi:flagellar biosynthesis activator protein FlaF